MERMTGADKEESERNVLIKSWQNAFKRATDYDAWGQPVEALDIYQRLSKQLHSHSNSKSTSLFPLFQKKILEKIALCLDVRRKSLHVRDSSQKECISLTELKLLEATLENLLDVQMARQGESLKFPVDVALASAQLKALSPTSELHQVNSHYEGEGSLLPKPLPEHGKSYLTAHIDHIGVKDSSHFLDPFLSVSVKSKSGEGLSCIQDTPTASSKVDSAIIFDTNVYIEKALENLPQGYAIFFELKHFKPKKNAVSTYCWAFLEQDEVREGPIALELYKKPTDCQRKSLKLLTVKPLFLHLNLDIYC